MKEVTMPLQEFNDELSAARKLGQNEILNAITVDLKVLEAKGLLETALASLDEKSLLVQVNNAQKKQAELVKP